MSVDTKELRQDASDWLEAASEHDPDLAEAIRETATLEFAAANEIDRLRERVLALDIGAHPKCTCDLGRCRSCGAKMVRSTCPVRHDR